MYTKILAHATEHCGIQFPVSKLAQYGRIRTKTLKFTDKTLGECSGRKTVQYYHYSPIVLVVAE